MSWRLFYESNVGWFIYGLNKPKQKGTSYSMEGFCSAIKEAEKKYPRSQP